MLVRGKTLQEWWASWGKNDRILAINAMLAFPLAFTLLGISLWRYIAHDPQGCLRFLVLAQGMSGGILAVFLLLGNRRS